jgi:hypothetical protein
MPQGSFAKDITDSYPAMSFSILHYHLQGLPFPNPGGHPDGDFAPNPGRAKSRPGLSDELPIGHPKDSVTRADRSFQVDKHPGALRSAFQGLSPFFRLNPLDFGSYPTAIADPDLHLITYMQFPRQTNQGPWAIEGDHPSEENTSIVRSLGAD